MLKQPRVTAVPEIVIAEAIDEAAVLDLDRSFDVHYDSDLAADARALADALAEARALIVGDRTLIDADLLAAAPCLEIIGCIGNMNGLVDESACRARGIAVHRVGDAPDEFLAGRTIAALSDLLRLPLPDDGPGRTDGPLLGLLGFGTVARTVAERANGLGLRVVAYDPMVHEDDGCWDRLGVEPMALHPLVESCDAISLHLPLTQETRNLIDWELLIGMRPGAVLVNASRSGIVDVGAVVAAVGSGRLAGAALDVWQAAVFASSPSAGTDGPIVADASIGLVLAAEVRRILERRGGARTDHPVAAL